MFNLKLYIEGLKKLKIIGFTALILCVGISIMLAIGSTPSAMMELSAEDLRLATWQIATPLLMLLGFTPIIIYTAFRFLNKRNSADFYHAIPYKRKSVYLSFVASALTWILAIIVITMAVASAFWGAVGYWFEFSQVWEFSRALFAACVMIAGFTLVAMMVTGTFVSNVFITVLIMSFVRVVGMIFIETVKMVSPIIDISSTVMQFFEYKFFLPISIFASPMDYGSDMGSAYTDIGPIIYAFVLGLVLIVAGMFLYERRHSEMANKSASSKKLQHIFRIAITMPFALLVAMMFFQVPQMGYNTDGRAQPMIMLTITALIVYFLYEIITTKSFKRMLKSAPLFLVVVLGGVVFALSITGVRTATYSFQPNDTDIASIRVEKEGLESVYTYGSENGNEVFVSTGGIYGFDILDDNSKMIVARALKDNISALKGKKDYYWGTTLRVSITTKSGKKETRNIMFEQEQYAALYKSIMTNGKFKEEIIKLPEGLSQIEISGEEYYIERGSEGSGELFKLFIEKYKSLSDDQKAEIRSKGSLGGFGEDELRVVLYGKKDGKGILFECIILEEDMPEFYKQANKVMRKMGNEE